MQYYPQQWRHQLDNKMNLKGNQMDNLRRLMRYIYNQNHHRHYVHLHQDHYHKHRLHHTSRRLHRRSYNYKQDLLDRMTLQYWLYWRQKYLPQSKNLRHQLYFLQLCQHYLNNHLNLKCHLLLPCQKNHQQRQSHHRHQRLIHEHKSYFGQYEYQKHHRLRVHDLYQNHHHCIRLMLIYCCLDHPFVNI